MFKKIQRKLKSGFVKALLLIFVTIFVVRQTGILFSAENSPTLKEVLAKDSISEPRGLPLVVVVLFAVSLAAFSVAKSYEVFQRNKPVARVSSPKEIPDFSGKNKDEELKKLKQEYKRLLLENPELKNRLKRQGELLKASKQIEQALRRSSNSLNRECKKVRFENEALVHEINSLRIEPTQSRSPVKKSTAKKRRARR